MCRCSTMCRFSKQKNISSDREKVRITQKHHNKYVSLTEAYHMHHDMAYKAVKKHTVAKKMKLKLARQYWRHS